MRMTILSNLLLVFSLTVALAGIAAPPAAPKAKPVPHIRIFHVDGSHDSPDIPDTVRGHAHIGGCYGISREKPVGILWLSVNPATEREYSVTIANLLVGDVIPIGLGVYRVDSMTPGPYKADSTATIVCRFLDNPPEGATVTEGALSFPFNGWGKNEDARINTHFHGRRFRAKFVASEGNQPDAVQVYVVEPTGRDEQGILHGREFIYTVREGDLLKVGKYTHRVVNIVPPDPKTNVIGWFEVNLEPEPMPDEEK